MRNQKLIALLNALCVAAYTGAVVSVLFFIESRVKDTIFAPIFFLLLFVLSASVVGALILGGPVLMYLDGRKKEAINMFVWTLLCLAVIIVLVFLGWFIMQ